MSNFPTSLDDDISLPFVNDNITEIGGLAINSLRDAVFALEQNIGTDAAGTTLSVSERLSIALNPDGSIKSSAITSLGLVTLPITEDQIATNANIPESKLRLDHRTQDLFNYIRDLSKDINLALRWTSVTGVKLDPHLLGALYRHSLSDIDVNVNPDNYLKNKFGTFRDNNNSYFAINDLNSELLTHQFADGSNFTDPDPITTFNGSVYPATHAHTSSGIFLNTSRFSTIPQTADDLQQFAEFIDSSSIFLYGTRIQNLYSNGISKVSRSSSLSTDGYGAPIIPPTPAIAYLLNTDTSSSPVDDIDHGDDIIEFVPSSADQSSNSFDAKFALVKVGDIVRINYGTVEVPFLIKEKKYIQSAGNKKYIIRIAGKNLAYSANAVARIDKTLVNNNKFGVLAMAAANNNFAGIPSLIVGSPRGAQVLGLGFNPDQFDANHYLLYLVLYPTGFPQDGYTILPAIDVTGNKGATPGSYTLESIIASTNTGFRQSGYNYRFIAFSYQGEFGIMLADSYNNTAFSVISAVVDVNGNYDQLGTNVAFQSNVVGIFADDFLSPPDPLGFGPYAANIASPPYMSSYGSAEASQNPTKLFIPLKRNNYYVNGSEREKLTLEEGQVLDGYGDGYWTATIQSQSIIPGAPPTGRVSTTYRIDLDLKNTNLKEGKTIVVQSLGEGGLVNFGRFIIQSLNIGCSSVGFTDITVYDAVHGTGLSPAPTLALGSQVAIYFNSDSVSFNKESATDISVVTPFKRHFEVLIDQDGKTFTHERGRFNASSSTIMVNGNVPLLTFSELTKLDIIKISPKLRGYQFGSVTKVSLHVLEYNDTTGIFDGYLCSYDGTSFTHKGPIITGHKGEITRFYDETNIDYIDILFNINIAVSDFISTTADNKILDFQLFPTLSLDQEIMLIGTCQLNDVTNVVSKLRDERQFGNTSEKEFSSSALEFLSFPEKALHGNGVVRGFDLADRGTDSSLSLISNPEDEQIFLTGGVALVNGKFIQVNNQTIIIPTLKELSGTLFDINWILCINDQGEYQPIPLLDFDPALSTPNNPNRLFRAFNVINGSTYYLDAITFSNLINNRKDLTPLYIVASHIIVGTPSIISLNITDARRYINDADTNLPLRLTSAAAQGNFKSPVAIFNWIKYNNIFNSTAFIKGADEITGIIDTNIILDFNSTAIIDGENDALLTMNGLVTLGSNLTLKNLDIIFNGGITLNSDITNLLIQNCNITINVPTTSPTDNVIFDIISGDNINITDCTFNIQYTSLFNSSSTQRGAVFRINNTSDFYINNTSLNVLYDIQAGTVTPGDVFVLIDSDGVIIENSDFSGNFNKFIGITSSNNLKINNVIITSTYNPFAGGSPDSYSGIAYSVTDLVNTGQAWIYGNVSSILENIIIDNVTFNYQPVTLSGAANRYSFINFELFNSSSILNNLVITNCKFNNTVAIGDFDDIRTAVSIINKSSAGISTSQQPIVANTRIANNLCNKNQSIIITSVGFDTTISSTVVARMVYPGIASNNITIENNICGTIGYWISSGSKIIGMSPNVNSFTDKTTGLLIKNNICHYIASMNSVGAFFPVSFVISDVTYSMSDYPSGNVIIESNKTNWIHTGIAFEESSSLIISKNNLNAYSEDYIAQFGDNRDVAVSRGFGFAIMVLANKYVAGITNSLALGEGESTDSSCIIDNNSTSAGYWLQTTSFISTFKYSAGYILCQSSNIITNNILKGIDETSDSVAPHNTSPAIFVSGINNNINNNRIYRVTSSINSYVAFSSMDLDWDGSGTNGIIVDNFFDSPIRNDVSGSERLINIQVTSINNWLFERNKNQTGYAMVPLGNQTIFPPGIWGPKTGEIAFTTYITTMEANGHQSAGTYRSSYVLVNDAETAAIQTWGFRINVEAYLPSNVRLLTVKEGMRGWGTQVEYFVDPDDAPHINGMFFLNIMSQKDFLNPSFDYTDTNLFATPSSTDTTINEDGVAVYDVITGGEFNSTANNIPLLINLENYIDPQAGTNYGDISHTYISGRGRGITLAGDWRWYKTSTNVTITFSPIQIKYRW